MKIDFLDVLYASLIMLVLAVIIVVLVVYLSRVLALRRDARIDEILAHLPCANCGGCGSAGCEAFAIALIEGKAKVSDCGLAKKQSKNAIADILGGGDTGEETVAVVCCAGGNYCKDKYEYVGYGDCKSSQLLAGGKKECDFGCMGFATCYNSCGYFAIEIDKKGYAKIDKEKCVSCGMCIRQCPKQLIRRIPRKAKVYLACSNDCKGKDVRNICERGCIGCGLCAKFCEQKAITMQNNLPVIDYDLCTACKKCVEKCPSKCIKTC